MSKKEIITIAVALLIGAMASGKILALPIVNKLPRF